MLVFILFSILILLFLCPYDIVHTLKGNPCLTHIREDTAQPADRPDKCRIVGSECNKFTYGDIAMHSLRSPQHDHGNHLQTGDQVTDSPVKPGQCSQLDPQICKCIILLIKAFHLELFSSESPYHPDSRGILLHHCGELPFRLVCCCKTAGDQAVKNGGVQCNHRHKAQNYQGQLHIHGKHHPKGNCHQENRTEHFQKLCYHKVTDHLHI